jgi:hypothetical protein
LLGLAGDEVIHCIIDLMYAKAPYTVMQRAMHIHPTVSEFLPTMMQDFRPLQWLRYVTNRQSFFRIAGAKISSRNLPITAV